ncbi:MAG TPA: cytochrome c [Methylovirgula sp.]
MRRWLYALGGLALVAGIGAAAFFFLPEPEAQVSLSAEAPQGDALIKRGEYLARAADCITCHTAPHGEAYAGGLPFKLPFGTIYSPNITPDKETGIGAWSDADFVRAIHRGVAKDGHMLYPAFPYASYALLTDDDALAIKAYLFSLAPVKAQAPANALIFPFNQTYLMRAWRLLFVPNHPMQADSGKSPNWNRGAYLVEALGHCGECHTPRNLLYGLDNGKKFSGAEIEGWMAYNISSDPHAGVGAWSDDQLASFLSQGHAPGRSAAAGAMAEAIDNSLRYLDREDIVAIVAYLRSVPAQTSGEKSAVVLDPPAVKVSSAYSPAPHENTANSLGLHLYEGACASCHGWNGTGLERPQAALLGNHTANDPKATNLIQVMLNGANLATSHGAAFMPAFKDAYSDPELAALGNYVVAHFGAKSAEITADDVAHARHQN